MSSPIESARALLKNYTALRRLEDVRDWRTEAEATISQLNAAYDTANSQAQHLTAYAQTLREESKQKSFLGHIFKSADEKSNKASLLEQQKIAESCQSLVEHLQERIDNTPSDKNEQTLLLKELKALKKELQLRKKEINAQMRDIRTTARQKSVDAAHSWTAILTNQKYTAAERRSIRYNKKNALAPHEDEKAVIDRQILSVEHEIIRVESYA